MAYRDRMSKEKTAWARRMRQNPTPSEKAVWAMVRGKRLGHRFRRQVPMLGYIVDFYCPAVRLVVEVDGSSHVGREEWDAKRDVALLRHGFSILRLPADAVEDEPELVQRMLTGITTV